MKLFIDTSAFIAITDRRDQYHELAANFLKSLNSSVQIHTSNYIMDETITRIRITAGHNYAVSFAEKIFSSSLYFIHYVDEGIENKSFELFRKMSDQKLSFTDCTSFVFMKSLNISKAFAFDDDFKVLGFETIPGK